MCPMNLCKVNEEVFIAVDPIVRFGDEEIAFLKQRAQANARKRARICAHKTNDDALHEMVIAISAASYIHPHKHVDPFPHVAAGGETGRCFRCGTPGREICKLFSVSGLSRLRY